MGLLCEIEALRDEAQTPSADDDGSAGDFAEAEEAAIIDAVDKWLFGSISRPSGSWSETDFDVFDGERDVGRIVQQADGSWFWGVSFQLPGRKSYGWTASFRVNDSGRASRRRASGRSAPFS
jgi:hypothetical protein